VRVLLRGADGSETLWSEGSEYSLSGAGAPGGGTVEVITSPTDHTPAAGETLVVKLAVPPRQETSLPLGGAFPSTAVEGMADLAVLRDQQIEEALTPLDPEVVGAIGTLVTAGLVWLVPNKQAARR
jgi:hypothetical protein